MEAVQMVLTIVFSILLWILYHRIFHGYYRDVFYGVMGELVAAVFCGFLLAKVVVNALGGIAEVLLKILLVGLAAAVPLSILWAITFLRFLRKQQINPFQKGDIPALNEIPVLEPKGSILTYSYWKAAHYVYRNRIYVKLISVLILGGMSIILLMSLYYIGEDLTREKRTAVPESQSSTVEAAQEEPPPKSPGMSYMTAVEEMKAAASTPTPFSIAPPAVTDEPSLPIESSEPLIPEETAPPVAPTPSLEPIPEPTPDPSAADIFCTQYGGGWEDIATGDDSYLGVVFQYAYEDREKVHYTVVYNSGTEFSCVEGDFIPDGKTVNIDGTDSNGNVIQGTFCIDASEIPGAQPGDYGVLNCTVIEGTGEFRLEVSDTVLGSHSTPNLVWP